MRCHTWSSRRCWPHGGCLARLCGRAGRGGMRRTVSSSHVERAQPALHSSRGRGSPSVHWQMNGAARTLHGRLAIRQAARAGCLPLAPFGDGGWAGSSGGCSGWWWGSIWGDDSVPEPGWVMAWQTCRALPHCSLLSGEWLGCHGFGHRTADHRSPGPLWCHSQSEGAVAPSSWAFSAGLGTPRCLT